MTIKIPINARGCTYYVIHELFQCCINTHSVVVPGYKATLASLDPVAPSKTVCEKFTEALSKSL